ncbi:hypothetical protein [Streptomyces avermitilis]|uniref:hypothetical protein n=1 Tax=Streptomyces avermitilis TaxID=33903 RepID=UPI00381F93CC
MSKVTVCEVGDCAAVLIADQSAARPSGAADAATTDWAASTAHTRPTDVTTRLRVGLDGLAMRSMKMATVRST